MTPAARLQAAVEILDALGATAQPADGYLRDWFRARRYAGSKDRAAVAERVYDVLRHRASFTWRMQRSTARSLVLASLIAEHQSESAIAQLFSGEGYGPAPLTEEEKRAIASSPPGEPPLHVRGEYPEWLGAELERAFGPDLLAEMQDECAGFDRSARQHAACRTRHHAGGPQFVGYQSRTHALFAGRH